MDDFDKALDEVMIQKYLVNAPPVKIDRKAFSVHGRQGLRQQGRLLLAGEYSLLLYYLEKPVAATSITFNPSTIVQIQGAKNAYNPLSALWWERLIVSELESKVAETENEILMQSSMLIEGWDPKYCERLKKHYDMTAYSLGYKLRDDLFFWKQLPIN